MNELYKLCSRCGGSGKQDWGGTMTPGICGGCSGQRYVMTKLTTDSIEGIDAELARLVVIEQEYQALVMAVDKHVGEVIQNTGHRDMPEGVWFYRTFSSFKRHWPTRAEAENAYRKHAGFPPATKDPKGASELSDDDLKDIAQQQAAGGPQPGEVYQHYKGGLYSIVVRALREDTFEPVVIYHSNRKGTNWERTLANFTEILEIDGRLVPRFDRILE